MATLLAIGEKEQKVTYDHLCWLIDMRSEFKLSVEGAASDEAMNSYR
jgi:hypothetical protein